MVDKPGGEFPEFSEEWAASGVSEASLRRHAAPPAAAGPARPGSPTGAPAGPRDWSPAGSDRTGVTSARASGRRRWPWFLAVVIAGGAFLWPSLRQTGHSAHAPIASASPVVATPSGTDPAVLGLTPAVKTGACFNLPDPSHTSTAQFRSCQDTHTYEFVALETATGSDTQFPDDSYWNGPVRDRCTSDLVAYAGQPVAKWSPNLEAAEFIPRPEGWADGDRHVYCVAQWDPAQLGSAKDLKAYVPPHSVITAPAGSAATTVVGRLSVDTDDHGYCLAITVGGTRLPVDTSVNTLSWVVQTNDDGTPDNTRSGIAAGPTSAVDKIFLHAGDVAHLTGRYQTDPKPLCGSSREFVFTAAH